MNEVVYTEHLVDDQILSPDDAMEKFRQAFPMVGHCNVYAEGNIMSYRLRVAANAKSWESLARSIIKQLNLPLEANVEVWQKGGVTFEVNLCIEYKAP